MMKQTKMEKWLLHAGRMLTTTLDYEELMKLVLELTIKATDAEAAIIYRIDHDNETARARFAKCGDESPKYFRLPKGEGIIGWVAENREPAVVNDLKSDERFYQKLEEIVELKLRSALAVPLIGRGQMIGVVEAINKTGNGFDDSDMDILFGLANQFAVAIDNANLYRDARKKAVDRQLLYEVGKKLLSTLDIDEVLKQIIRSLAKVVGYDAAGLFLVDEKTGDIDPAHAVGYDDNYNEIAHMKIGQGLVGWSAKSGEAAIVPDVTMDKRYISTHRETKSEIVVPIKVGERIVGVLNMESNKVAAYDRESLYLIDAFASQAAVALERAMLHEKMLKNKSLDEQLKIARQIQLSFLPKKDPIIKGYDVSGINIPSGEVGGDYYDFLHIIDHQTGVPIADVSGKGIPASLIMASFRASLIAEIRNNYAIRIICRKVNSLLYESVEDGNYVTAFYGVLDSKNHIFTFSNCGHNQPILLRVDGTIEFLLEGGPALGVIPGAEYEERPVFIHPGDLMFLYTDGVSEIYDKDGVEFGVDNIIAALKKYRSLGSKEILEKIYEQVKLYAAPSQIFDDLTMVALKRDS